MTEGQETKMGGGALVSSIEKVDLVEGGDEKRDQKRENFKQ